MKGGNMDELQSGKDRQTAENNITVRNFTNFCTTNLIFLKLCRQNRTSKPHTRK